MCKFSLKLIIILTILKLGSNNLLESQYKPIKCFSIILNKKLLDDNLKNNKMQIIYNLQLKHEQIIGSQTVASISQINLNGSQYLQFYFNYKIDFNNSIMIVDIFCRNKDNSTLSQNLFIVLDFLIAKFPMDYTIMKFDVTSYQQHLQIKSNRSYQLLFFLNGFINMSLSGSMTHSYQSGDNIFTIHYMNKKDHSKQYMGWREQVDYLNFTLVLAPAEKSIQKFRLTEKKYSLDYPEGWKYFYGIKGSQQQQFVGAFEQRIGGIKFQAKKLEQNLTYGIVFLPIPATKMIDTRLHNQKDLFKVIGLSTTVGIIISILLIYIFRKPLYKIFFLSGNLSEQIEINNSDMSSDITNVTKNDEKNLQLSRQKYIINTVQQVDQKYQISLRASKNNSLKQPQINLED